MTALLCIVWAIIGAVTAWGITLIRASAALSRLETHTRQQIGYWQQETARARARAAQLARDAATRTAAWKEGRDDVIAIMPLIASANDGGTCSHRAADVMETI